METFLTFKRLAIEYNNYEEAIKEMMSNHLSYIQSRPKNKDVLGKYR